MLLVSGSCFPEKGQQSPICKPPLNTQAQRCALLSSASFAETSPALPAIPRNQRADSDGHQADNSSYQANLRALAYALFNIVSASSIVFANKAVFSVHLFRFTYSLTFLHTLVTLVGMMAFAAAGVFQPKKLPWAQVTHLPAWSNGPWCLAVLSRPAHLLLAPLASLTRPRRQVLPVAAAYVAYIVFGNLNLKLNSVSFYQIGKIAVAPAVLAIEAILYRRLPSLQVFGSVSVVCVGIAFATISELEGATGPGGAAVGVMAVLTTALYQARHLRRAAFRSPRSLLSTLP